MTERATKKRGKRGPPAADTKAVQLRIPTEMQAWLKKEADAVYGTVVSQVLQCIAAEMKRQQAEQA